MIDIETWLYEYATYQQGCHVEKDFKIIQKKHDIFWHVSDVSPPFDILLSKKCF